MHIILAETATAAAYPILILECYISCRQVDPTERVRIGLNLEGLKEGTKWGINAFPGNARWPRLYGRRVIADGRPLLNFSVLCD